MTTPTQATAREAVERVLSALPEFQRVDDYLLAGGASVMSDNCHQIMHVDTLEKIVEAVDTAQWACKDCGAMGQAFRTVFDHEGDSDVECLACGSVRTDEAGAVMRYLAEQDDSNTALLAAKQEELDKMRADLFPLQEFMDSVFGEFPDHGDIDGFDLEHIAEACGLLKKEATITPCGEHCGCAESGIADGTETQCYRVQPVMRRARIAVAKRAALSPSQQGEQP